MLDELEEHLSDDHLHVIAPPGSGKTVLGLEVALRLNKPTLVLAPTLAIRNQWVHRFCELFLDTTDIPDWISTKIKAPAFLTVSTYQALHSACTGVEEIENDSEEESENVEASEKRVKTKSLNVLIQGLKKQGIATIVVDEAHHLKNAWWQSLIKVKDALNPTIIGLTATPPYDVSHAEWVRYQELNGPVDAEISVPELVVEGDLCPHQDYIWFSRPEGPEYEEIRNYRERIKKLFQALESDEILIKALSEHTIYDDPGLEVDWIYSHVEYYSAILIFLKAAGKTIEYRHLEIIGNQKYKVPKLDYEWMEVLLKCYLFDEAALFPDYKEHQLQWINKLRRAGAVEGKSINLEHSQKVNKLLKSSISKLRSVEEIVSFEYQQLQQELRMVVLTDFIRKEFLADGPETEVLNKIGAVPIFEQLRRSTAVETQLGILTGSLVVIPANALKAFEEKCSEYGVPQVKAKALAHDNRYLLIETSESLKTNIVHIVTQVFQEGHIEVLIGTKSLLGEGWDAPAINALILASFVGSYVLSNQMRGRAIRAHHGNTAKTGNIWHLVCIDPSAVEGGYDLAMLQRRFRSFVGLSHREEVSIENEIDRINLPEAYQLKHKLDEVNQSMRTRASAREELRKNWTEALEKGQVMVEEMKVPYTEERSFSDSKELHYRNTIKYTIATLLTGVSSFASFILEATGEALMEGYTLEEIGPFLAVLTGAGALIFGRQTYKAMGLYLKYRDISKDVEQIAKALLQALIDAGAIHSRPEDLYVDCEVDDMGAIYCHLEGGTTFEKSTFIKALQEILDTVENPRYLIVREGWLWKKIKQSDYHAVPEILGRKKELAKILSRQWRRFVGECKLVYTRMPEGRQLLLKSKVSSLSAQYQESTQRVNKWK